MPLSKSEKSSSILATMARCSGREARGILMLRKDKKEVLEKQIKTYFQEGYPRDYGMVATGIMVRKHTEEIKEFCKLWYNEVEKHSLRDQMSFNYTTWKTPINYCLMPFNILQNQFKIHNHLKRKEF